MLCTGFPYRKLENESGHGKFMEHENLAKSHGMLSKFVGFFAEIKKLSIHSKSPHFLTFSAKCHNLI